MNLPELPKWTMLQAGLGFMFTQKQIEKYGAACYAKGRADLLAEIGEPVAEIKSWVIGNGFRKYQVDFLSDRLEIRDKLYVLPKEQKRAKESGMNSGDLMAAMMRDGAGS